MKKLLFFLLLTSCVSSKFTGTRPLVITEKTHITGERNSFEYRYIDNHGEKFVTYSDGRFNERDTIR